MRIKLFIVTYNNNDILKGSLNSLFENVGDTELEIFIINNHSNLDIEGYEDKITVLNNQCRPDFSIGHLSRNWNQAIINGFQDLDNPDCDILILAQNDVIYKKNFLTNLIEYHKKYSFIQFGRGDELCSYLPIAVKNVGLWDERFCNICHQEADYFLRQLIYNTNGCSINDFEHARIFNLIENTIIDTSIPCGAHRQENSTVKSAKYWRLPDAVFKSKWNEISVSWNNDVRRILETVKTPNIQTFYLYPYFELKIDYSKQNLFDYRLEDVYIDNLKNNIDTMPRW